jgi:putative flippase GtrA
VRIPLRRWATFNLVGSCGFVLQISTITVLTRVSAWPAFGATAVGLELAALANFVGHSRWTWRDRPEASIRGWLRRYGRYQAAKTLSLIANLAITTVLVHAGAPVEIANTAFRSG